jgi:hypothetical protein
MHEYIHTRRGNKFIPDFDRHISKVEDHIGDHDVDVGITLKVML